MVDGVTKLDSLKYGKEAEAKTVRKMVVAMSQDIRVLVVKLCDRLHNARTWKYMPIPNAQRKAKQTLEIYAPLANRLGLGAIKLELENLSFATLEPKIYNEIVQLIAQRDQERKAYVDKVLQEINDELEKFNIKADVSGRPKHYYSIYRKMVIKGHEFKDIYDLTGVRIITNSVRDCYAALGAVHAMWPPVPGRFKDYIALPKYNMYQSLHTSVYGPEGRPVEFQIRTQEMHRHAEYGVAAHWKYKEKGVATKANKEENSLLDMRWLKQLTEWQEEEKDSAEFLESLRFDLGTKEVYVFTPQGAVKNLPAGSTPVDFAYSVHTDVGKKTMGARVNGKLVTLDTELKNGDTVEIITSRLPDAGPSRGWLDFVKSNRAKTKIRQYFTKGRREESIEQGKDMLAKAARKKNLPLQRLITKETLQAVVSFLNIKDIDTLYMSIGEHQISTEKVLARIISQAGEDEIVEESDPIVANKKPQLSKKNSSSSGVVVKGVDDVWVKLARCCMPVPGDEIVGFITRGHGVSVHQVNCKNLMQLIKNEPERKVEAKWADSIHEVYFVQVGIEALDRINLLTDISRLVSEHKMSITSLNSSYKENRTIMFRIGFEIGGPKQLEIIIRELQKIDGVFDVYRLNQG
jgi:GTP pyrophosphokinase